MDTSNIIRAEILHNLSSDVYKTWRKNFCKEIVQPFINQAAEYCLTLAKNGHTCFTSQCQPIKTGGDEEKVFKEEVYEAFHSNGYKVCFPQRSKNNIAVILSW